MKTICIHKNGVWWSFMYEPGGEEELLQTMLARAESPDSEFTIDDVVAIVKSYPALFAKAA